ncbi:hypothetical protein [Polyangium sp. 15x6]|uniref:hypothetical protein n=1 Tax=Polyangium sp. 15x6 TaxID=3042687 RepID=UPI00249CC610|nr:hypothetical protein [Polyangium sp. 15x6]MDI3291973.1 hypothetical protein [Polyangium sp. 15x6]
MRLALEEPEHEPITEALLSAIQRQADPPGAFRAWALSQPWSRFCAIVRVVAGAIDEEQEDR